MRLEIPTLTRAAAAACVACTLLAEPQLPALAVVPSEALAAVPSEEAQVTLRKAFQDASAGLLPNADKLFTQSIREWERLGQPPDELAALRKARGTVRQRQGRLNDAIADLDAAVDLILDPRGKPDPAEVQRTFVLRARANSELKRWKETESDLSAAIARLDDLDAIEATNPFLFAQRSDARARLGMYSGAADDATRAALEFGAIGDKLRRALSNADAALALYGAGDVDASVDAMKLTFKNVRSPNSNNPDDIGLLQARCAEIVARSPGHGVGFPALS